MRLIRSLLLAVCAFVALAVPGRPEVAAPVTLNIRDYGATGDGKIHTVNEWIKSGRYRSLREIQKDYPFVGTLGWSLDEIAFERAKQALPIAGGTLYFPAGHYIAAKGPWHINRDDVRLLGDGADRTTLSTAPGVPEALVLAPPRHGNWLDGAGRVYPFTADSGRRGDDAVQLKDPAWGDDFREGELVFVRNGANRFDQDYGEFNEIASIEPDGRIRFRHPLARDYTLAALNWAGEIAEDFKIPALGQSLRVPLRHGDGLARPGPGATVSVGDALFQVEKGGLLAVHLSNPGRGNPPPGTVIRAGTKVALARVLIKVAAPTRNFRAEKLRIVGRHKVLDLSNSYDTAFADCTLVRDLHGTLLHNGVTIYGDGGRYARFERCRLISSPAAGMQFSRSFGNVTFADCTFTDTNVAFTGFTFAGEVVRCTFEVRGGPYLANAIVAGRSCADLRLLDNQIHASDLLAIFDTLSDVQAPKTPLDGVVLVRGNFIDATNVAALFAPAKPPRFMIDANRLAKKRE